MLPVTIIYKIYLLNGIIAHENDAISNRSCRTHADLLRNDWVTSFIYKPTEETEVGVDRNSKLF